MLIVIVFVSIMLLRILYWCYCSSTVFFSVTSSFTKNCAMYYRPLNMNWDLVDLTDFKSHCKDLYMSYVINYVHICILALFCIILAVITVVKLHFINNVRDKEYQVFYFLVSMCKFNITIFSILG